MFPVPFPGEGGDKKGKALDRNEGAEVPPRSLFHILWYQKEWLLFPSQDMDKILLDLQDDESVYRELKEALGYVNPKVTNCTL